MKKRVISILLTVAVILSVMPMATASSGASYTVTTIFEREVEYPYFQGDVARNFYDGVAGVRVGYDTNGYQTSDWVFINTSGEVVFSLEGVGRVGSFNDGLAVARVGNIQTGKWGFINTSGEMVIPAVYDGVNHFSEGLAEVLIDENLGFINTSGEMVIPAVYGGVKSFSEGLAAVLVGNKWGFINSRGETVIPAEYDDVCWFGFNEGLAAVSFGNWETGYKWGFVNTSGEMVIPAIYNYAQHFSEGLAFVSGDEGAAYINASGEVVLPFTYFHVSYDSGFTEGLAVVMGVENNWWDAEWGFINTSGEVVIPFGVYGHQVGLAGIITSVFRGGLAIVSSVDVNNASSYGVIDTNGEIVIPIEYDDVMYMGNVGKVAYYGLSRNDITTIVAVTANTLTVLADPVIDNALAILRYVVGLSTATPVTVETHDYDGNGVVEIADALQVLRYVVGLSSPLDKLYPR